MRFNLSRGLAPFIASATMLQCSTACSPPRPKPCEDPGTSIALAGVSSDPKIGTYEGRLLWLQTDDETVIRLTVMESATETIYRCGAGATEVDIQTSTSDNIVNDTLTIDASVTDQGYVQFGKLELSLDPVTLVDAGKTPEAPGIVDRTPTAKLTFTSLPSGGWDAEIQMVSSSDRLHLAIGSLEKVTS